MPKIRRDKIDDIDQPIKEKRPRRKPNHWEEFDRGHRKLNKRTKKKQVRT
jgi:hypothetical protein|tara:strand:- start:2 stop:151 length:150 start_codon:yes stop_codon:yes gene_type:complete